MSFRLSIVLFLQIVNLCSADHYRGGTISWRPLNSSLLTSPVTIIITERHSWTLTRYQCNQTTVSSFALFNDTQSTSPATLTCINSSAVCAASLYQTINSPLYCTDYSVELNVSSGFYASTQSLAINSTIAIAWRGAAWTTELLTNEMSLVAYINLTPVSGKINTSPVTGSLPIIRILLHQVATIQLLVADWDSDQFVRCRWSYQAPLDECGDVCSDLPKSVLSPQDCYVNWTGVLRSADIANGLNESTYVIAITAEDFTDPTSTTPLSSIPHQMLVNVYTAPSGACSTSPAIVTYPRRNLACIGGYVVNSLYSFTFQARIYCVGDYIVEFITSTPFGMIKFNMTQAANDTWTNIFRWTPRSNQTGVQPFCVAAIDNHGVSTTQYCYSLAVGSTATAFITPTFVQGSASPFGAVLSSLIRFSIQTNVPLKRTTRDGTYIRIYTGTTQAYIIDCRSSPDIFYLNRTIVFFVRNYVWIPGATYYLTFTEGVATADIGCGMESGSSSSNTFWTFTIWDSSKSSTTTVSTITTTATTHTVTTRVLGTTSANTLYSTTGIPVYSTTTTTLTTSTSATTTTSVTTTSESTTTTSTTTTTEYIPDAEVLYPKDMEQQCLQPVTIATGLITLVCIPIHLFGMINLFVKMKSHLQNQTLKTRNAYRAQLRHTPINNEERQSFV